MDESIEELQARANGLGSGSERSAEAVELNEAVLRIIEGDLIATRRLSLALVQRGELDRAEEVVEEALLLHPDDAILRNRECDIARARRRAKVELTTGTTRRGAPSGVARTWLKAVHYDGTGWDHHHPGDVDWLSDPGQRDPQGNRHFTLFGEPRGRPSWRVGEQFGIYLSGTHRVPVLAEITVSPAFQPELVQKADWAEPDDGERWPWVTWFRVLKAVSVDDAPTLADLGIANASMQQRARLLTDAHIHGRLVQALGAAS